MEFFRILKFKKIHSSKNWTLGLYLEFKNSTQGQFISYLRALIYMIWHDKKGNSPSKSIEKTT